MNIYHSKKFESILAFIELSFVGRKFVASMV